MSRALRLVAPATVLLLAALATPAPAAAADTPASDLAVTAQAVHGKVGTVINIPTVFKNLGPEPTPQGAVTIEIVAPGGTEIEADPRGPGVTCTTFVEKKHFVCTPDKSFAVGSMDNPLPIMIVSAHTTPGFVAYSCTCDPTAKNNKAALVVTVDGATPSASPSHHPSPKPSATHSTPAATHTTAAPTTTPVTAPSPTAAPSGAGPSDGGPSDAGPSPTNVSLSTSSSGPGAGLYLVVGALLIVALGAGAWWWHRRSRSPRGAMTR